MATKAEPEELNGDMSTPTVSADDHTKSAPIFGKVLRLEDIPTWEQHTPSWLPSDQDRDRRNFPINTVVNEKISLIKHDITKLKVDAIVNAARGSLLGGGGVDGAIHDAAGPELLEKCRTLGGCSPGEAKLTKGFNLPASYVIHTVGPEGEKPEILRQAYQSCLQFFSYEECKTMAFPCISTGSYGYPDRAAAKVALQSYREFLEDNLDKVERIIVTVFNDKDLQIYEEYMPLVFPRKDRHQSKEQDTPPSALAEASLPPTASQIKSDTTSEPEQVSGKAVVSDAISPPSLQGEDDVSQERYAPHKDTHPMAAITSTSTPEENAIHHDDTVNQESSAFSTPENAASNTHLGRQDRQVARNATRDKQELLKQYNDELPFVKASIRRMTDLLNVTPLVQKRLKHQKITLDNDYERLDTLRAALEDHDLSPRRRQEVDELAIQVRTLIDQYRGLYPKANSQVASSVMTTMATSVDSNISVQAASEVDSLSQQATKEDTHLKMQQEQDQVVDAIQRQQADLQLQRQKEDEATAADEEQVRQAILQTQYQAKRDQAALEAKREADAISEAAELATKKASDDAAAATKKASDDAAAAAKKASDDAAAAAKKADDEAARIAEAIEVEKNRQIKKAVDKAEDTAHKLKLEADRQKAEDQVNQLERRKRQTKREQEARQMELDNVRKMADTAFKHKARQLAHWDDYETRYQAIIAEDLKRNQPVKDEVLDSLPEHSSLKSFLGTQPAHELTLTTHGNKSTAPLLKGAPSGKQDAKPKSVLQRHQPTTTEPRDRPNSNLKQKPNTDLSHLKLSELTSASDLARRERWRKPYQRKNIMEMDFGIPPMFASAAFRDADTDLVKGNARQTLDTIRQQNEDSEPDSISIHEETRERKLLLPQAPPQLDHELQRTTHQNKVLRDSVHQTENSPDERGQDHLPSMSNGAARTTNSSQTQVMMSRDFDHTHRLKGPPPVKENTTHLDSSLKVHVTSEESPVTKPELARTLAESFRNLRLPVQEPSIFTGDPLLFTSWFSRFQLLIDEQDISAKAKLMYLEQYLGGPAKESVKACFMMRTAESYQEAIELLEERYGSPLTVAKAYKDRLESWPNIRAREGIPLRDFSDFIGQCKAANSTVSEYQCLNDQSFQWSLVHKLPTRLQESWARRLSSIKQEKKRYPTFDELAIFIKREADILCETYCVNGPKPTPRHEQKGKTYQIQQEHTPPPPCANCNKLRDQLHTQRSYLTGDTAVKCNFCAVTYPNASLNHLIFDCRKFKELTVEDRKQFVYEKHLCFQCFQDDHQSRDCKIVPVCEDCKGRHPVLLHGASSYAKKEYRDQRYANQYNMKSPGPFAGRGSRGGGSTGNTGRGPPGPHPDSTNGNQGSLLNPEMKGQGGFNTKFTALVQDPSVISHNVKDTYGHVMSTGQRGTPSRTTTIVPVIVSSKNNPSKRIITYAMLDTMSSVTFMAETLIDRLEVASDPTSLTLSTMTSQGARMNCRRVSGITVQALDRSQVHHLGPLYSTSQLTDDTSGIATPEMAMKFPHLRRVASHLYPIQKDATPSMLIGYDHPDLLVPLKVIKGNPFAIRTALGWSVVGRTANAETTHHARYTFAREEFHTAYPQEKETIFVYRATIIEPTVSEALRTIEKDFVESETGTKSPDFLKKAVVARNLPQTVSLEEDPEVHRSKATSVSQLHEDFVSTFQVFTRWSAVIRSVAAILRMARMKKQPLSRLESKKIAEDRLVLAAQRHSYAVPSKEQKALFEKLNVIKDSSGCLRVAGRQEGKVPHESLPKLLPRDSHLTLLLVRDVHESLGHAGRTSVIHAIRSRGYWIFGIRRVCDEVTRNCVSCKRQYGKECQQRMANLPHDRIEESAPFTACGMDCFGPFVVVDGRKQVKRYGLMITCLSMRAIHLEVLEDLSTNCLIDGLRRVTAIRGQIRTLRCDRGTNFIGAERQLREAWKEINNDELRARLEKFNIEWVFNTPKASHAGGVWERQIGTVRRVLSGLMMRNPGRLNTFSLWTFLYEVMAIVNSRPLSVESLEDPTGPLPLTPNHILTMKHPGVLPIPGVFEGADVEAKRKWRRVQRLADEFWRLWRLDFLNTLQQRRKWLRPQRNVSVDDVVILRDDAVCRSDWPLGRVVNVHPSDDGLVRTCDVKTLSGTYRRPITKLVVLIQAAQPELPAPEPEKDVPVTRRLRSATHNTHT